VDEGADPATWFHRVHRRYRRRGIARALLAEVFSRLVARGVSEVSTEIDETNTASRALLEGLGARRTGTSVELVRRWAGQGSTCDLGIKSLAATSAASGG